MPHCRRILASSPLLPLLLLVTSPAGATYSIVATDQATRAVGGAVASCVGSSGVTIVYGAAPGFGGINAQASVMSTANRDRGVQLLQMGVAPNEIIQQLNADDQNPNVRQYGVVDLQGRAAGFTGTSTQWHANHRTGSVGTYTYGIQGNILTGESVLDQAETGFRDQGCDLAERLMLALEAGAQNGQGDRRCTSDAGGPIPANAASIEVDLPDEAAGSYLRLSNAQNGQISGVARLRTQFNTWRQTHPCPGPSDAGADAEGGTTADAARDVTSESDAASSADAVGDRSLDVTTDSATPDGTAGTAGTAGAAGAAGAGTGGGAGVGGASGGTTGGGGTGGSSGGTSGAGGSAGGNSGSAGASGTAGSGGSAGRGGSSGGGTSAGSSGSGNGPAADAGCSCRLHRPDAPTDSFLWVASLIAAAFARSRYRR